MSSPPHAPSASDQAANILDARGLHIPARGALPAMSLDLTLVAGELVMIHSNDEQRNGNIVDRLLGLHEPPQAGVSLFGREWVDLDREQAFLLRREVGRVRHRGNWMEGRSVMDNILLPAMHNTVTPEAELRLTASALAQQFGLPGLPTLTPSRVPPPDLQRAACVRAFLGRPTLVILEHTLDTEESDLLVPIMSAIQQVRRRRGAVLWFTGHLGLARDRSIPVDRRLQIVGARLVSLRS
jgi:phospholipid/cholesterol/gamma-HCH transport system ATP-binding protein